MPFAHSQRTSDPLSNVALGVVSTVRNPSGNWSAMRFRLVGGPKLNTVIVYVNSVPAKPSLGITFFVTYTNGVGVGVGVLVGVVVFVGVCVGIAVGVLVAGGTVVAVAKLVGASVAVFVAVGSGVVVAIGGTMRVGTVLRVGTTVGGTVVAVEVTDTGVFVGMGNAVAGTDVAVAGITVVTRVGRMDVAVEGGTVTGVTDGKTGCADGIGDGVTVLVGSGSEGWVASNKGMVGVTCKASDGVGVADSIGGKTATGTTSVGPWGLRLSCSAATATSGLSGGIRG